MRSINRMTSGGKAGLWIFLGLALLVAALLAVFVSPWASSSPDGLEKVAEDKGFMEKAEEKPPSWRHSPVPDYAVKGVKNGRVATGLSGMIGVLITLGAAVAVGLAGWGVSTVLGRKDRKMNGRERAIEA